MSNAAEQRWEDEEEAKNREERPPSPVVADDFYDDFEDSDDEPGGVPAFYGQHPVVRAAGAPRRCGAATRVVWEQAGSMRGTRARPAALQRACTASAPGAGVRLLYSSERAAAARGHRAAALPRVAAAGRHASKRAAAAVAAHARQLPCLSSQHNDERALH